MTARAMSRLAALLAAIALIMATLAISGARAAVANSPTIGAAQWLVVASNNLLGVGANGTSAISTYNPPAVTSICDGASCADYQIEETAEDGNGNGQCLFYDASNGYWHWATCNQDSEYDEFGSLSSNNYSMQMNIATEDCFYSDGNGGRLTAYACQGDMNTDRWSWQNNAP